MKIVKRFSVLFMIGLTLASCQKAAVTKKSLATELDSVSYALGMNSSLQLGKNFDNINKDLFVQAFKSDTTDYLIEEKSVNQFLSTYYRKMRELKKAEEEAETMKKYEKVKQESITFLNKNKSKEGVMQTESGLQYMVMKAGSGKKPAATDQVKVHYHGTLIDGTVFDSSVDRGEPASFGVNRVIKGWTEGLQLMKEGAKYKFFIPQELAYGSTPRKGGKIRPFDALIFEVELLEVK
jgi:FKBP-type peptidyl-prolyl cis-trans isomerase